MSYVFSVPVYVYDVQKVSVEIISVDFEVLYHVDRVVDRRTLWRVRW